MGQRGPARTNSSAEEIVAVLAELEEYSRFLQYLLQRANKEYGTESIRRGDIRTWQEATEKLKQAIIGTRISELRIATNKGGSLISQALRQIKKHCESSEVNKDSSVVRDQAANLKASFPERINESRPHSGSGREYLMGHDYALRYNVDRWSELLCHEDVIDRLYAPGGGPKKAAEVAIRLMVTADSSIPPSQTTLGRQHIYMKWYDEALRSFSLAGLPPERLTETTPEVLAEATRIAAKRMDADRFHTKENHAVALSDNRVRRLYGESRRNEATKAAFDRLMEIARGSAD